MKEKSIVAALLAFFICSLVSGIIEGGGGVNTTALTQNISAANTTIPVTSTAGFLNADYIHIGDEKVYYTGRTATQFTGVTRGWGDTSAAVHTSGVYVYSNDATVINATLGFNVAQTGTKIGYFDIPVIVGRFFFVAIPRLILWDFQWLQSGPLVYFRYILFIISAGFVISIALLIASALGGILQSVLRWV